MSPLGVAIIGSGIFVKEEHLPAVLATPQLKLKAIYSRSLKSAQALSADADLYSDDSGAGKSYNDLLQRSDIDCCIIALPIMNQPEFIEAALAAGKHVLSEKPIAENVKRADELINFYKTKVDKSKVTWGVAENFRYLEAIKYARKEIEKQGKIYGFSTRALSLTGQGGKYIETSWRKDPSHQGGFLLDGGVHTIAIIRQLLGPDEAPAALSAESNLVQSYLPPVDTLNSIWVTKGGVSGTFALSYGSSVRLGDHTVWTEKGNVTVKGSKIIVRDRQGHVTEKDFPGDGFGVKQEVAAWAKGIQAGKLDTEQSPEQALADLELLEVMLRSGEAKGEMKTLVKQI